MKKLNIEINGVSTTIRPQSIIITENSAFFVNFREKDTETAFSVQEIKNKDYDTTKRLELSGWVIFEPTKTPVKSVIGSGDAVAYEKVGKLHEENKREQLPLLDALKSLDSKSEVGDKFPTEVKVKEDQRPIPEKEQIVVPKLDYIENAKKIDQLWVIQNADLIVQLQQMSSTKLEQIASILKLSNDGGYHNLKDLLVNALLVLGQMSNTNHSISNLQ